MKTIDFNSLLDVPMEKWHGLGVKTTAVSATSNGLVNSFIATVNGRKVYGYRKHEFINGEFTGKQSFIVENFNK